MTLDLDLFNWKFMSKSYKWRLNYKLVTLCREHMYVYWIYVSTFILLHNLKYSFWITVSLALGTIIYKYFSSLSQFLQLFNVKHDSGGWHGSNNSIHRPCQTFFSMMMLSTVGFSNKFQFVWPVRNRYGPVMK